MRGIIKLILTSTLWATLFLGCASTQRMPDTSVASYVIIVNYFYGVTKTDYLTAAEKGTKLIPTNIFYTYMEPLHYYTWPKNKKGEVAWDKEGYWSVYFYDVTGKDVFLTGPGIYTIRIQRNESLPDTAPKSLEVW